MEQMRKFNIMMNVLGMIVAILGVFIEPVLLRASIVLIGVFLSSIRIDY